MVSVEGIPYGPFGITKDTPLDQVEILLGFYCAKAGAGKQDIRLKGDGKDHFFFTKSEQDASLKVLEGHCGVEPVLRILDLMEGFGLSGFPEETPSHGHPHARQLLEVKLPGRIKRIALDEPGNYSIEQVIGAAWRWLPASSPPLLLASERHMSGKRKPVTFSNLVHWSDAILEVRKRTRHITTESIPLGGKPEKAFQGSAFAYEVVSIVMAGEGLYIPKSIKVHCANDLLNYFETRRQQETSGHKIFLNPYYQPETPQVDTLPTFLIFTKHSKDLDRFFFTADQAIESVEKTERIRALVAVEAAK